MAGKLDGRIAIITGGARGQGAATARIFAAEGARVVIADMLEAEGAAVARELGTSAAYSKLDVSDEKEWNALAEETAARWGAADILINNAGVVHVASLVDLTKHDFERVLQVNVIGPWLGIKIIAPAMIAKGKGSIVNICSTAALWGMNGLGAYSASKWALRGLTKTAAMELGCKGVRVNAVFPGGVNTAMSNSTNKPGEELDKHFLGQPIQRIAEPEEIARASLFLASDDASYLCGAELAVDGGLTLGKYSDSRPGAPNSPGTSL
jgi:3alpha(or 20beta)-hydroxysteroid dehydrogenase